MTVAVSTNGCATIVHGTSQDLKIETAVEGIEVSIYRWNGEQLAGPVMSPVVVEIPRPKWGHPYLAVASKPGYCPVYFVPGQSLTGMGVVGITFVLLTLGMGAVFVIPDASSGANYNINEEPFAVLALMEAPCE